MRFASYCLKDRRIQGIAVSTDGHRYDGILTSAKNFPGDLQSLVSRGPDALAAAASTILKDGAPLDLGAVSLLPPLATPGKILCIGLNYADHSAEFGFKLPDYPAVFARFACGFVGHNQPIVRPKISDQLDYEGELVAVIGRTGRHIPNTAALEHVAGYSIFNDGSVRDYQLRGPQWTVGKNFDATGGFGPMFVTADELPAGGKGLRLKTRLNGELVQSATTGDMVFDVASLVSLLSKTMTLYAGDIIVTGTPSGIGMARKPPLWMKPGDLCEVEIEGIGILRNPIVDETDLDDAAAQT